MANQQQQNKSQCLPDLYQRALQQAAQPQSCVKHTQDQSVLLTAPNNIIFELFNTVVKEVSSENLLAFVTQNLADYLDHNWTNKILQRSIKRLRHEQAVDRKAGLTSLPLIRSSTGSKRKEARRSREEVSSAAKKSPPINYGQEDKQAAVKQIYEHIMWRIKSDNVTQITSLLVKLALDDGYKRSKLKAQLYEDVAACFEDLRSNKLIKLYSFGNAPPNDQKLLLSNTNQGDLSKWVANYIDGSEKSQNPNLIGKLAGALRDKTKNCLFITNDIEDALKSVQTGAIRGALVVDRLQVYDSLQSINNYSSSIEPLIRRGKIYIISSLNCVQFAPDPASDNCC